MSELDNVVFQVLRTNSNNGNDLIKQIESIAEQRKLDYSWQDNKVLNAFIDGLKFHVSVNEKDWREDDTFLELINAVNNQIIIQINDGEKDMATGTELATTGTGLAIGTKFIIAAGVLSVIAIALYAYRCSKNKTDNSGKDPENLIFKGAKIVSNIVREGAKTPDDLRRESEQRVREEILLKQQQAKPKPSYEQYNLLLVTEAKRLDKNIKLGNLSKNEAETIISNAMFAYCFAENDLQGKTVLEAVELSKDEDINYDSEDKVFLQLYLSAKPKIAEGKPDKLGIREAMNPNQPVEIKTLKKLLKTRSVIAFYGLD